MEDNSKFYSGPNLMRQEAKYASPGDISRLRQRMLNAEEAIKELKAEIETLKNK
jgi:SMC interacting uncharacterized protein involved in chromosome segregation